MKRRFRSTADHTGRELEEARVAIWPLDDGSYGLDATFQGAGSSGYERGCVMAMSKADRLGGMCGVSLLRLDAVSELGGGWTLRFGPLSAAEVGSGGGHA